MEIQLGKTLKSTKRSISIEVLHSGEIIGTYVFDKLYRSHSFIEVTILDTEVLLYVFGVTKELVEEKLKCLG